MKVTRTIEKDYFYCDVCGNLCSGSYMSIKIGGKSFDSCGKYWEQKRVNCHTILKNRLNVKIKKNEND